MLRGWRDEPFAIRPSFAAPARPSVERAAAPLLGAPAYGGLLHGLRVTPAARRPRSARAGPQKADVARVIGQRRGRRPGGRRTPARRHGCRVPGGGRRG